MSLISSVALESFQQEGSALLHLVEFKEDVAKIFSSGLWVLSVVSACDHFTKADSCLSINRNDLSHDLDPVRLVTRLLTVLGDLVKLVSLDEPLNDLIGVSRLLEDGESKLWVDSSDHLSELL